MKIKNVYDDHKEFVYVCAEDVTVDELCAKFQIKKSDFILYNGILYECENIFVISSQILL